MLQSESRILDLFPSLRNPSAATFLVMDTIVYHIDASDVFCHTNEAWRCFAVENQGDRIMSVIGRSLWEFIQGDEVRHLYREILSDLRRRGGTSTFPFRCDAPKLARELSMQIRSLADGSIEFQSTLIRSWPQTPRPVSTAMSTSVSSSAPLLQMCSWCKQVKVGDQWKDADVAIAELGLFVTTPPQITHGICKKCHGAVSHSLSA